MKKSIIVAAVAAALVLGTSPANAVAPSLPAGDSLFEVACDNDVPDFQLFSLDLAAMTRDLLGGGLGLSFAPVCALQGAILPGSDWFYYPDDQDQMWRSDLTSGDVQFVRAFAGNVGTVYSITITPDGDAYALDDSGDVGNLYSLDLSTGALSLVGAIADPEVGTPFGEMYGFAYDGVTEKFYGVEDTQGRLFEFDVATRALTLLATNPDYTVRSMSFDSEGNLWVNGSGFGRTVRQLTLANFGTTANWTDSGSFNRSDYSRSLVVRLPPVEEDSDGSESLADTGAADATPYLLGGLLAAGIALALRRRRV